MSSIRVILWDQLTKNISSLHGCDMQKDMVLIGESLSDFTHVKHHKKKIAFLLSAMRHFARELEDTGYQITYVKLGDEQVGGSIKDWVTQLLKQDVFDRVIVTHPSEYRVLKDVQSWQDSLSVPVEIREDDRFFCSLDAFSSWASGSKQLRMEYFYRKMRKDHDILMDGTDPVGGKWNYDLQNRKTPKGDLHVPTPYVGKIDEITKDVLSLVGRQFGDHFGDLEPFYFAVTRKDAVDVLDKFINERLALFGDFQDAMIQNEPWMYHSHISFYLNCGLLSPFECVQKAQEAYRQSEAPLNAVEGFIRQIMGWREYVRGIYWLKMPDYAHTNFLEANRDLPDFYWSAETKMNCLRQCVKETKENAYAHHIQRLMVLGNFALLIGVDPKYVNEWFLIVYADAYQWVELPNVSGMILFADGGYLASKPYAAGGSYINKMSNYCKNCVYKVSEKNGETACPFNYMYWSFLARNRDKLQGNHRISMMYKTLDRMGEDKQKAILADEKRLMRRIDEKEV